MKKRAISFNGDMIRAILTGDKTQTRRPVKLPVIDKDWLIELAPCELAGEINNGDLTNSKYGIVGDRLLVREASSIRVTPWEHGRGIAWYRCSEIGDEWSDEVKWLPPQCMPLWASRILLEITSIRIERLHDISQEDAKAEGFKKPLKTPDIKYALDDYLVDERTSFAECWDGIYSTWSENPWVWVIGFKVLSTQPQWEAKA